MTEFSQQQISEKCFAASQLVERFASMEPMKYSVLCENITQANKRYTDYHRELTKLAWELNEVELAKVLRHYRVEQHAYLACRDILGLVEVVDTLQSLSDLAAAVLDVSYYYLYAQMTNRYGVPRCDEQLQQHLVIFGMGKLGGGELNFSSDIDLILAYPQNGYSDGDNSIDNELFFHRLAQKLIRLLDKYDSNGFVYRIDMRLKPFGSVGTLCTSFASMQRYYLEHGRNWERYALVKMRPVAGDSESGYKLLSQLESFVYQRHVDYQAVSSIEEMKQKIIAKGNEKSLQDNLKLGHGGIREIEFIVQTFQMMYGGRMLTLRHQSLLRSLEALADKALISPKVGQMLANNYKRLRKIENAIQYYQDQQTHDLPNNAESRKALLVALGIGEWLTLVDEVRRIQFEVSQLFTRVFAAQDGKESQISEEKQNSDYWLDLIYQTNVTQQSADLIAQAFVTFYKQMSQHDFGERYLIRLNWVLPQVILALDGEENPVKLAKHMLELLTAIASQSMYLSLLVEHPSVLKKIMHLFMRSTWMTRFLCQHPLVIDELIHEDHENVMPLPIQIKAELQHAIEQNTDNSGKIQKIMDYKNAQVFRVASADLQNRINLMHVSDQLTGVAEAILDEVLNMASATLEEKYGKPCYVVGEEQHYAQFGIIAYGKLGGFEMGYNSDLDLIFLHNSQGNAQQTNGKRSIANEVFFTHLVAKIIQYLTTAMSSGKLYEVDTRLRPSGNSGLAVTSLTAFENYQRKEAWTWEHQALVRARFIAGGESIKVGFEEIRRMILCQSRKSEVLRHDVLAMRQKMLDSFNPAKLDEGWVHIKHQSGGVTDIEFIVQYLLLKHGKDFHHLIRCSDNMRQISALELFEILRSSQASELRVAYRRYRLLIHHQQLLGKRAIALESEFIDSLDTVRAIWDEVFTEETTGIGE